MALIMFLAACGLAGCGSKLVTVDVSGTVTYNGKPLNDEGCHITFLGSELHDASAPISPSGEYKVTGVAVGPNKVAVYYRNPEAAKPVEPSQKGPPKAPKSTSPLRSLPKKYADPKTSDLRVDVATGTVYDIKLTGPELK
jgi:hypothetical protein